MEQRPKKVIDSKHDRVTKNRGDGQSLLRKVIEELDIQEFLRVHDLPDRGDSKAVVRNNRTGNLDKSRKSKVREKKITNDVSKPVKNESKNVTEDPQIDVLVKTAQTSRVTIKGTQKCKLDEFKNKDKDAKISTHKIDQPQTELFKANKDKRNIGDGKTHLPLKELKGVNNTDVQRRTYLDYEGRKWLRERYTVKLKSSQNSNRNLDSSDSVKLDILPLSAVNRGNKNQPTETNNPFAKELSRDACQIDSAKLVHNPKEPEIQRKPLVKTIRLTDSRVYNDYKSVSFINQKDSIPIQIKIPNAKKENSFTPAATNTARRKPESKTSVQITKKKKREKSHTKRRPVSPITVISYNTPQTEVAKWAPSCLNGHKPYYEAWVDTTLAAVTKCSEKEKSFFKQDLIKTFKRALKDERPPSPELVYEKFNDEMYTGKIKVRTAKRKRSNK